MCVCPFPPPYSRHAIAKIFARSNVLNQAWRQISCNHNANARHAAPRDPEPPFALLASWGRPCDKRATKAAGLPMMRATPRAGHLKMRAPATTGCSRCEQLRHAPSNSARRRDSGEAGQPERPAAGGRSGMWACGRRAILLARNCKMSKECECEWKQVFSGLRGGHGASSTQSEKPRDNYMKEALSGINAEAARDIWLCVHACMPHSRSAPHCGLRARRPEVRADPKARCQCTCLRPPMGATFKSPSPSPR